MVLVGYTDLNNITRFYDPLDAQKFANYLYGNTGLTVAQIMQEPQSLAAISNPTKETWSFSNVLQNLPKEFSLLGNETLGIVALIVVGLVLLK